MISFSRYDFENKPIFLKWIQGQTGSRNSFCPLILLLVLFSACDVTKFLEKDEFIVRKNQIQFQNLANKKNRKTLEYELSTFYLQKELPASLIGKRKNGAWYYLKGLQDSTPSRFWRWQYKNFAKRPAIFNDRQTDSTVSTMKRYLKNQGYLYPSVYFDKDFKGKDKGFADITYHINPGALYILDTINFYCTDTAIQYLLSDTRDQSFLQKGTPLSASLYDQERMRITETMNNSGYARFTPNYISQLDADTIETGIDTSGNRKVNITLTVQMPSDGRGHLKFYTADVIIYPNYDARLGETIKRDTIVDGKIFFTYDGVLGVKPQPLSKAIAVSPGTIYKKEETDRTIKQLTNMNLYKFVNVKANIEECDSTLITYKIYLTPTKKMSIEPGVEINYSSIASTTGTGQGNLGRLGLAVDLAFEHKNAFKGAERFRTSLFAGADKGFARLGQNSGLSFDVRSDVSLSIPKFVDLYRSWKILDKTHLVRNRFYQDLKKNASTDYNIGYVLSDRLGLKLYRLQQFNLGVRYILKKDNGVERYNINQTGIELNLGKLDPTFEERIKGQRAFFSFQPQLMTGFAFRSFGYEYAGKPNKYNERWQYSFNLEQSGSEVWLAEKIVNPTTPFRIKVRPDTPGIDKFLNFSKYWRLECDLRYSHQITAKKAYAARLSLGLAVPFADASSAPYSRLFFVGGPNSIRAWLIRGLGPGKDPGFTSTPGAKSIPFQAGDLKFDFNSEYRFPVFWRIESAIFLDAGNVWNLKETFDPKTNQPLRSKFTRYWYDDIAIGTGLGLRIDVTYALIRLDFGYKLRTPFDTEDRWVGFKPQLSNFNPNFALGLPF
jgi:outer membrane protein insertion porin family